MNLGWECPKCHNCYAPNIPGCNNCNKPDINPVKSPICDPLIEVPPPVKCARCGQPYPGYYCNCIFKEASLSNV